METISSELQQFLEVAAKQLKDSMDKYDFSVGDEVSINMKETFIGIFCEDVMVVEFNGESVIVEPKFEFKGIEQYDIEDELDTEWFDAENYINQINEDLIDLVFEPKQESSILGEYEESLQVKLSDYFTKEQIEEFKRELENIGA